MKQTAVVKSIRIVQMPIMNCLNAMPSDSNLTSVPYVSIDQQMRERGMKLDPLTEIALDKILKDYDRAWKTLGNM